MPQNAPQVEQVYFEVDRRFVTSERVHVTVAMHEGSVRTFIDPAAGHEAEIITSVDAPAFADFWLETVLS